MADYNSSLPIRTETAGDVIVKLADKTTPSQQVAVDSSGNLSVLVNNTVGSPVVIRPLTNADIVTVEQGAASNAAGGWFVRPTDGTNSQSYLATGEAIVSVTQPLPAGTNTIGNVNANLRDGAGTAITSQANGSQRALDVGINVAGVQVDPRDTRALTATDVVTANQGAPAAIGNAWYVQGTDGTNSQAYLAGGEAKVAVTQPLPAGTNNLGFVEANTRDGSGNQITSTGGGAHRALDVAILNGTAPVSSTNPMPVVISNAVPGTEILDYKTVSALAAGASDTHTYTVTALKTLTLQQISASASGKIKVELQFGATSKLVKFNSTSSPNVDHSFFTPQALAAASTVNVIITNLDKQAMDVYSTIEGVEN